jgi:hypothetical protein
MTEFDPLKAQREIVSGLRDVCNLIKARSREAQGRLAEAEANAHALMKIERWIESHLESETMKLRRLTP